MSLAQTPSQTAGPFLAIGMSWNAEGRLVAEGTPGEIEVAGAVTDGAGDPVTDAVLEFFQADANGRFADEGGGSAVEEAWTGFGRALSDAGGCFRLVTVKPGAIKAVGEGGADVLEAPHLDVSIFARGLLQRLVTRIYFDDEHALNERDPVLSSLADAGARARLVAWSVPGGYRFDVRLQGEEETPFFLP